MIGGDGYVCMAQGMASHQIQFLHKYLQLYATKDWWETGTPRCVSPRA
jgi:hypothetical protein